MQAFSTKHKTDQADLTDWMYFLSFNLMEEIITDTEPFSTYTESVS